MTVLGFSKHATLLVAALGLLACDGDKPQPAETPPATGTTDQAKADPPAEKKVAEPVAKTPVAKAPEAKAPEAKTPEAKPAEAKTAPAAEGDPAAKPAEKAADAPPDKPALPGKNTVIREGADPESPEGIIQRALMAAMEPDEPKAWEQFEALLHTSEQLPNALVARRQMNFPAMRRKVKLFLLEDETKPIFKISYIEERPNDRLKIFVHNKKSFPTPCNVERDKDQDNKWRIASCSL